MYEINIPKGALVALCAAQNSGKTWFCKKHFEGVPNCTILYADDIFYKVIDEADDSDTRESIHAKANQIASKIVYETYRQRRTLVYDSMSINCIKRLTELMKLRRYFSKIILIVIDLDEEELAKHGVKTMSPKAANYGFSHPNAEVCKANAVKVKEQIADKSIGLGVNRVYRITSKNLNRCCVTIE